MEVIRELGPEIPLLGVCLGHQAIGACYGARVVRAGRVMHGKTSPITHSGRGDFRRITHAAHRGALPLARDRAGERARGAAGDRAHRRGGVHDEIQAVRHREHPVWGVQFHPESIASEGGHRMLRNFLAL